MLRRPQRFDVIQAEAPLLLFNEEGKKRLCLRGKISLNVETDPKRKKPLKEYVDENYS